MIFRWHSEFKKEHLSAELAFNSGRPESVVNNRIVYIVCAFLRENRRRAYDEVVASTNISKISMFNILQNSFAVFVLDASLITLLKKKMQTTIYQHYEWKKEHQKDLSFLETATTGDEI